MRVGNSGARKDVNASRVAFLKDYENGESIPDAFSFSFSFGLLYFLFANIHRTDAVSLTIGTLLDASFGVRLTRTTWCFG